MRGRIKAAHLLKMRGRLHFSHGLHERVAHDDADVCARVALRPPPQLPEVRLRQTVLRGPQVQLEHRGPGVGLGQRDVDAFLKPQNE